MKPPTEGPERPAKPPKPPGRSPSATQPVPEAPGGLSNAFERGPGGIGLAPGGLTDQIFDRAIDDQVHRMRPANRVKRPGRPITPEQVKLIHVAKAQTGMSEEAYRQVLRDEGVLSSKDLTDKGFEQVMRLFAVAGFLHQPKHPRIGGRRPGMATQAQIDLIHQLWRSVAADPSESALNHWLHSKFQIDNVRFVTADKVTKVIAGLKAWATRASSCTNVRERKHP